MFWCEDIGEMKLLLVGTGAGPRTLDRHRVNYAAFLDSLQLPLFSLLAAWLIVKILTQRFSILSLDGNNRQENCLFPFIHPTHFHFLRPNTDNIKYLPRFSFHLVFVAGSNFISTSYFTTRILPKRPKSSIRIKTAPSSVVNFIE